MRQPAEQEYPGREILEDMVIMEVAVAVAVAAQVVMLLLHTDLHTQKAVVRVAPVILGQSMHQDLLLQVVVAVVDRCGPLKVWRARVAQVAQVEVVLALTRLLQVLLLALRAQPTLEAEAAVAMEVQVLHQVQPHGKVAQVALAELCLQFRHQHIQGLHLEHQFQLPRMLPEKRY
jgi:hypothetical protein